jgi:BirA family biotin operon repressor/biotin-[acetyl-CoA-carboxylase] ligase
MQLQQHLLGLLADGQLHSGSELAAELGVTRSAVWKHMRQLESLQLEVVAQAGQGYRLTEPLELLDRQQIFSAYSSDLARNRCGMPNVLWVSDSTSDHLLQQSAPDSGRAQVCLAEYQSAGRGRRGRQWFAPVGSGICLSVAWTFAASPANLSCLGLATGVGVLRALHKAGVPSAQLKWPNDIVVNGGKLAGILIDVRGEAGGPLQVVAGVGVNYRVNMRTEQAITESGGIKPASLLASGAAVAGRNATAALLAEEISAVMSSYVANGFTSYAEEWNASDCLAGRVIEAQSDGEVLTGTAQGIAEDGRLKLQVDGKLHHLVTGDITIRPTQ